MGAAYKQEASVNHLHDVITWGYLNIFHPADLLLKCWQTTTHCFPVYPRAQHLLRTQILCPGHKNVSDFVQKHYVSATNVSQFAQPLTSPSVHA